MNVKTINILYKNIIIDVLNTENEEWINTIIKEYKNEYNVEINLKNINTNKVFEININENYILEKFIKENNIEISEISYKIIKYINIIKCISDNYNGFYDGLIKVNNKNIIYNRCEIFNYRNYIISNKFLSNYFNKENKLPCFFMIRDLIENLKLMIYFYSEDKEKIEEYLSKNNFSWKYNIKTIIKNDCTLKKFNRQFKSIESYNNMCNNYIHKNGIFKFNIIENNEYRQLLNIWFEIIKFNIIIISIYDGHKLASIDYIDALENNCKKDEQSKYWIAPIFQNFIDEELTKEEKNIIKESTYMFIN